MEDSETGSGKQEKIYRVNYIHINLIFSKLKEVFDKVTEVEHSNRKPFKTP